MIALSELLCATTRWSLGMLLILFKYSSQKGFNLFITSLRLSPKGRSPSIFWNIGLNFGCL